MSNAIYVDIKICMYLLREKPAFKDEQSQWPRTCTSCSNDLVPKSRGVRTMRHPDLNLVETLPASIRTGAGRRRAQKTKVSRERKVEVKSIKLIDNMEEGLKGTQDGQEPGGGLSLRQQLDLLDFVIWSREHYNQKNMTVVCKAAPVCLQIEADGKEQIIGNNSIAFKRWMDNDNLRASVFGIRIIPMTPSQSKVDSLSDRMSVSERKRGNSQVSAAMCLMKSNWRHNAECHTMLRFASFPEIDAA
ncbi:hypothetical protein STEG23_017791, partial [Scotinomys teguina]